MASRKNTVNGKPRSLPEQTRRLWAQFGPEDRVLVVVNADPDALASALALRRLLWRRVVSTTIARINEVTRPDNLTMMRLLRMSVPPLKEINLADFSKFAMVDSQPHHSVDFPDVKYAVIIDHHPVGDDVAQKADLLDIRPRYGATSSMLTEYLRGAKIKPSSRLATALVYGIKTDTAIFRRAALAEDLSAFRYLFPKANHAMLRKIDFSEMRVRDLDIIRRALEVKAVRKNTMFAHLGMVKSADVLVQIADFFLKVDIVDISVVSGVCNGRLVVIMRNAATRSSAGKLMEQAFSRVGSAGGHKAMARAEMPLDTLEQVLGKLDDATLTRFVMRRVQRPWVKIKGLPDPPPPPKGPEG